MYLKELNLQEIQPCTAQGNRIKIKASLSDDVSGIFPYLNGAIPSAVYNCNRGWLSFRMGEKIVTLFSDHIAVTKLQNETDAYETLDIIRDKINEIYEKWDQITPSNEMKKMPTPIDIYKLLPKKNCRICGEMTCMAFAGKLLTANVSLDACKAMREAEYVEQFNTLESTLQSFGLMD